ncbi:LSU ribosomal protein L11P [Abyssicoccus albus]|uniref:LSU ribosomal protein L11P n=2 Tax=Abyssicoccus albus TaxID=1817405 RepID=A0A3N5BF91_9BACL|nr:LSU ribosomal protein L11P [Abyssicoccus albus]
MMDLIKSTAKQLNIKPSSVKAVLELLNDSNTVPFIARYRKEMTGGLTEIEIKQIDDIYRYELSVKERKEQVIANIEEQGLMTDELRNEIMVQTKLQRIEDLYRPFKQKKKTRATEAKRKGLEPLAKLMKSAQSEDLEGTAKDFLSEEVTTVAEAIDGAKDIIAEEISDDAKLRKYILDFTFKRGSIKTQRKKNIDDPKKIYEQYYDYEEPLKGLVPHRVLAMNRAEKEKMISVKIKQDEDFLNKYVYNQNFDKTHPYKDHLEDVVKDALKRLILPSIEREVRNHYTETAEDQAIDVFSKNLQALLLQPPLKGLTILGVDPAYRTGCKLAVISATGSFVSKSVIYPHPPINKLKEATEEVLSMIKAHDVQLIAIGNGTASRETEQFIAQIISEYGLNVQFIIVNEAGASVYSASEVARDEFPEFNVEERSAVSIARRVLDPLSELVKIDPKSIGVGQYQHDVNQSKLNDTLTFVVETAVNQVGVNVNTASASLMQYVSGLSSRVVNNIIEYREEHNGFTHSNQITKVPRLGAKTYEQSIGFLRIIDGEEPLDRTPIHPESYQATYNLLDSIGCTTRDLGTDHLKEALDEVDINKQSELLNIGQMTLVDIIEALKTPERDPRDEYTVPELKSDVLSMEDLTVGMKLSGTVRNVVDFGAFIDIGVKQDGLVHISKMSHQFIKHPMDKLSVGDIVEVTVIEIDLEKERIALSMI